MALEDEIMKAGNFLTNALDVVKTGSSIFDEVKQQLGILSPVPYVAVPPATQPVVQTASTPAPEAAGPNVGLLLVIGVIAYIVLN